MGGEGAREVPLRVAERLLGSDARPFAGLDVATHRHGILGGQPFDLRPGVPDARFQSVPVAAQRLDVDTQRHRRVRLRWQGRRGRPVRRERRQPFPRPRRRRQDGPDSLGHELLLAPE